MKKTFYSSLFLFLALFLGSHSAEAACAVPLMDLELGAENASVKTLQEFLNGNGFIISATGVGSKMNETTYFGEKTKNAVIRFQTASGITPAQGYVGPKTRAKMQMICGGSSVSVTTKTPFTLRTVSAAQVAATGVVAERINFSGLALNSDEARVTVLREILHTVPTATNKVCATLSTTSTVFDKATEGCVKSFQTLNKLTATGSVDEKTNRALNSMFAQ